MIGAIQRSLVGRTKESTVQRLAGVAITVQFLALIRTLAEYFRLKYVQGSAFSPIAAEPYITGALLVALCAWVGVTCYMFGRYAWTVWIGVATVVLLLAFKMMVLS